MSAMLAENNVVLGPMAGITDAPFRAICKRMGAGLTYTEMVSAKGLHFNPDSPISKALLTLDPGEVPCVVQIFGTEPEMMARQAVGLIDRLGSDIAVIDINMGCPVSKVVSRKGGAALMRTPDLAADIVKAVADACTVPVTAKFRSGWSPEEVNAVEFAIAMQDAGAAAVCVHGRTRDQFYQGKADWRVLADVAAALEVPVIGSGDVFSAEDAKRMLDDTGVDAVMVARGSQGNPWVFREARALIDHGEVMERPSNSERIEMAREHAAALVGFRGEHAFTRMRKHVGWYTAEMPGATYFRTRANQAGSYEALDALLVEYRDYVEERMARRSG